MEHTMKRRMKEMLWTITYFMFVSELTMWPIVVLSSPVELFSRRSTHTPYQQYTNSMITQ